MDNKKGQETMQFLMDWGWLVFALIIAIGVLWYFGVFDHHRWNPMNKTCLENYAKIYCEFQNITFLRLYDPIYEKENTFFCNNNKSVEYKRKYGYEINTTYYYFIDSEINDCKNKK